MCSQEETAVCDESNTTCNVSIFNRLLATTVSNGRGGSVRNDSEAPEHLWWVLILVCFCCFLCVVLLLCCVIFEVAICCPCNVVVMILIIVAVNTGDD